MAGSRGTGAEMRALGAPRFVPALLLLAGALRLLPAAGAALPLSTSLIVSLSLLLLRAGRPTRLPPAGA